MHKNPHTEMIGVSVRPEIRLALKDVARREGTSMSHEIREAVRSHIRRKVGVVYEGERRYYQELMKGETDEN